MNKNLLNKDIQDFINKNINNNFVDLVLKGSPFDCVTIQELIGQIESKNKASSKLPTWFKTSKIYYPPKLNLEQTSSEITAQYKATVIQGKTIADLTGGFGVDSYYFYLKKNVVHHLEINKELSEIANHNFKQLGAQITCFPQDGILAISNSFYDTIYIDPSRRSENKKKVYYLKDCLPDITQHYDYLLKRCKVLLIKTSPMLDLTSGFRDLPHVKEVHIIAVKNEVKELLWIIDKQNTTPAKVKTININSKKHEFFDAYFENSDEAIYNNPKKYLYEPNAAIMKSGLYDTLCLKFSLEKLAPNSHLFTSNELIDFPGRRFEISKVIPYAKAEVKKVIVGIKANVSTRNFPETVSELKTKWKIKDGGDLYLFFTTDVNSNKLILVCQKVK